jgi:hypothetical protein
MRLPWKHEQPIHEQLRREAEAEGAVASSEQPEEPPGEPEEDWSPETPPETEASSSYMGDLASRGGLAWQGIPRASGNWDTVVTTEAPGLTGADELGFVVIEGGDVFIESELPDGDMSPLADAVEKELAPPYRARAVRKEGDLWAVSARKITLERFQAEGNEIELTVSGMKHDLVVDGARKVGTVPALELRGKETVDRYYAHAVRIEDDLWEVEINAL